MSDTAPLSTDDTFFAKAGRSDPLELADQMRRSLDDPCLKVVLEAVSGFVLILNENRQILAANQELLDALTWRDSCVTGLRPGEAFNCVHFTSGTDGCGTSNDCASCGAVLAILASQNQGVPTAGECRLSFYREGRLEALDFKVRATPLEVGGCKLTAFVLHDISGQKQRDLLDRTFLHDLLNEISGIALWRDALERGDPVAAARHVVALTESLAEEVVSQQTLLAAERGELRIQEKEFDVAELCRKLETVFEQNPVAAGRKLAILPLPRRRRIVSDEVLVRRVLVNMLKNAFEATGPGGTVQFWMEWKGDQPVFVVQNAGMIPPEAQAQLFQRSFSTRSPAGRGIGTYSMKLYGERYLGGAVAFSCEVQTGTRFFFSLPAQKRREAGPQAVPPRHAPHPGNRVLLVDDDDALLRLGNLLLTRMGYATTPCHGGMEALQVFRSAPGSFDIVITDWSMPGMGGQELSQRIREIRADIPILVCSGLNQPAVDAAVVSGWLSKPFTFKTLGEALGRVLPSPGQPDTRPDQNTSAQ